MRKTILTLGMIAALSSATTLADETDVVVVKADASQVAFPIVGVQRIVFGDEALSVCQTDGTQTDYSYADVRAIKFTVVDTPDAIAALTAERLSLKTNGRTLFIDGWDGSEARLAIYNAAGMQLASDAHWTGGAIDLGAAAHGVYILKINQTTLKFNLR